MPRGPLKIAMGNSVNAPSVVTRPILLLASSVNHRFPSGPVVMPQGPLYGVGTENSVNTPDVEIRPIRPASDSANHRFPSGPAVMPIG